MGKWIRKYKEPLLIATLLFFFVSIFVGVGSVLFTDADNRDIVARVGKTKIETKPFNANLRQSIEAMREKNPDAEITQELEKNLKNDILRELIIRQLFNLEAEKWGMKVAPQEVAQDVISRPAFQTDGKFNPNAYYEFVIRTMGLLPKEFEDERRQDLLSQRFRGLLSSAVGSTETEVRWVWQMENPDKTDKEWEEEKLNYANRLYNEKMIGILNLLLAQLSQKHQVKTFLQ